MSFGGIYRNNSGEVLVSSDMRSMHFAGKAAYVGEVARGLTDFPNFTDAATLTGRTIYRFTITSLECPLIFIKPSNLAFFYGVCRLAQSGSVWTIDVLQSTANLAVPTLYCFTTSDNAEPPVGNVGYATYMADGKKAFDSRQRPMALLGSVTGKGPTVPLDGGDPPVTSGHAFRDKTLDWNFKSDTTFTNKPLGFTLASAYNTAFSAPSITNACYSRVKRGYKKSCGGWCDCWDCQDHHSTSIWWALYLNVVRLNVNSTFDYGWTPYTANYFYTERFESNWFGGGGGGSSVGTAPYADATLNYSDTTNLLISTIPYD